MLSDAVKRIAEALEAAGWPSRPSDAAATKDAVENARRELDRAHGLLETIQTIAKRNPTFKPSVQLAARGVAAANDRFEKAMKKFQPCSAPSRLGSWDEALAQLRHACRDRKIKAFGDLFRTLDDGSMAMSADAVGIELPAAAFEEKGALIQRFGRGDDVLTPFGRFINVSFRERDIDRIWPMSGPVVRRPASKDEIHKAVKAVYDAAEQLGEKPPNKIEIVARVQRHLGSGLTASGRQIQKIADDPQHAKRRLSPGTSRTRTKLS